jgi:hypothetical protein
MVHKQFLRSSKGCIMPLGLILFFVLGVGCQEQEQKSKDAGQAIMDTVKDAGKTVEGAVQKKTDQLEEADNP